MCCRWLLQSTQLLQFFVRNEIGEIEHWCAVVGGKLALQSLQFLHLYNDLFLVLLGFENPLKAGNAAGSD